MGKSIIEGGTQLRGTLTPFWLYSVRQPLARMV